jgi:hypothetical protein
MCLATSLCPGFYFSGGIALVILACEGREFSADESSLPGFPLPLDYASQRCRSSLHREGSDCYKPSS